MAAPGPKRDLPSGLVQLLEWDKKASKATFEAFGKRFGKEQHRQVLKYLEISCHGLPWLFGVFALMYLYPDGFQLWCNLLILLIIDIVLVAVLKVR